MFPAITSGGSGYEIAKSLRFRSAASAYLARTFGGSGDRTKFTIVARLKRGALPASIMGIMCAGTGANNLYSDGLIITSTGAVNFGVADGATGYATTNALLRDPSSHYEIMAVWDTTNATAADRIRIYLNGVRQSVTGSMPAQNATTVSFNTSGYAHRIGAQNRVAVVESSLDGYLSEINFIDGQALDPSYFGELDTATNSWKPKKYTGTYGTNGFYLPFNDGSNLTNLCLDRSGNGNNWTAANVSLTAGVTYDWMDDTPTNNFATLNPLSKSSTATIDYGNLRVVENTASAYCMALSTIGVSAGKWYAEVLVSAGVWSYLGVTKAKNAPANYLGASSLDYSYVRSGQKINNASASAYGASYTNADIIGIALDLDAGTLSFYKNGVSQGTAFTGLSGEFFFAVSGYYDGVASVHYPNFGQRPFAYTPPNGFKALCTKNLPSPAIRNPKLHFDVLTHAGTGSNQNIIGTQFKPDLVWSKARNAESSHVLFDVNRGAINYLSSDTTSQEAGSSTTLTAFNADGFSVGSDATLAINGAGRAYVDWLWKAGGTPSSNNAGSIASQVSANTAAGFSIVTYTGTGANATVGHGLGVAPKMVIVKCRGVAARRWPVYHASLSGSSYAVFLEATDAQASLPTLFNSAAPTSSVFSVGTNGQTNEPSSMVAYCFAEISGYSKIGSYTGNGSTDGPFVYCGFRPRFVLIKDVSAAGNNWFVLDVARDSCNVMPDYLNTNSAAAEAAFGTGGLDITANGFKVRTNSSAINTNASTVIYFALADQPFNTANAR